MFSPFDDYLVHLKLAEAREMWARHDWIRNQLGDDAFEKKGPRGWRSTLKVVVDRLMRGGFGRSESSGDETRDRSAREARRARADSRTSALDAPP